MGNDNAGTSASSGGTYRVYDNPADGCFEISCDDEVVGYCDYVSEDGRMVLPHTVINASMRGRGLAARLVRHVLDDVAARNLKVVPMCWFVAVFIAANPQYQPLVTT